MEEEGQRQRERDSLGNDRQRDASQKDVRVGLGAVTPPRSSCQAGTETEAGAGTWAGSVLPYAPRKCFTDKSTWHREGSPLYQGTQPLGDRGASHLASPTGKACLLTSDPLLCFCVRKQPREVERLPQAPQQVGGKQLKIVWKLSFPGPRSQPPMQTRHPGTGW